MNAILNALIHKNYSKDGKTFDYYEALLTFNESDTCFVNCQLGQKPEDYIIGNPVEVDISIKAWNYKAVPKYKLF